MADLWRFQVREIEEAGIAGEDEDTRLEAEKRVLANAEKLYAAAMSAYALLYENEGAAEGTLTQALRHVEELARYDAQFAGPAEQLAGAKSAVEDVSAVVRAFSERVQASPERLEEIEDRLAALDKLKRKYGGGPGAGLAEVIAFGAESARKLAEVEDRDAILAELRGQREREAAVYRGAASAVSAARREAAGRLAKQAAAQINDLAMHVRFEVGVVPEESEGGWTAQGWDRIEYRIATNAGEPMKPLEEIASGGEMSRVMLALKVTVEESFWAAVEGGGAKKRSKISLPTPRMLVFDEIDIGIGGRAAEAVGQEAEGALATAAGGVHHAPAADCGVCGPAFRDREGGAEGPDEDVDPADGRGGADAGDCADAFRRDVDGHEPGPCAADDGTEPVGLPGQGRYASDSGDRLSRYFV